jgi:O-antigen ligase
MIYKNLSISNKAYKETLQNFFNFLVVFSCFAITLPTAWSSIFSGLILITWMIYGSPIKKVKLAFLNPGLKGTLLLILLYVLAAFYSSTDFSSSIHFLLKYSKLLLIPLILGSIDSEKIRNYGINAFLFGMLLTLFISYSKWLNIVPMHIGINDNGEGFHAFKNRIAHNYLMSFAVYLMLCKSYFSSSYIKWTWLTLSFLGFYDVFYLVDGRTGQVTLFFLLLFFIFHVFGRKAIKYVGIFFVTFFIFNAQLKFLIPERILNSYNDAISHQAEKSQTSGGIRLEMYKDSLAMIKKSPFLGYGTGAYRTEFVKLTSSKDTLLKDTANPHNQYLLTLFELGLVGFFALIYMFFSHWKCSYKLIHSNEMLSLSMRGLVISMMIGSLFNSLLLDATEGRFYCLFAGLLLSAYQIRKKK